MFIQCNNGFGDKVYIDATSIWMIECHDNTRTIHNAYLPEFFVGDTGAALREELMARGIRYVEMPYYAPTTTKKPCLIITDKFKPLRIRAENPHDPKSCTLLVGLAPGSTQPVVLRIDASPGEIADKFTRLFFGDT